MTRDGSSRGGPTLGVVLLVVGTALEAALPFQRVLGLAVIIAGVAVLVRTSARRGAGGGRVRTLVPPAGGLLSLIGLSILLYPAQMGLDSAGRFYAWNSVGWALLPGAAGVLVWAAVAFPVSATVWLLLWRVLRRRARRGTAAVAG